MSRSNSSLACHQQRICLNIVRHLSPEKAVSDVSKKINFTDLPTSAFALWCECIRQSGSNFEISTKEDIK